MIEVGSPVPEVTVHTADGVRSLEELITAPTLLVFFKRDCDTCVASLPVFHHWTGYAPAVQVLAVSQDDPADTAEFFAELGIDMPVVYDPPPYDASEAFQLLSVPSLVLVEDGGVTWASEGWQAAAVEELALALAALAGRETILVGADTLPLWKPG